MLYIMTKSLLISSPAHWLNVSLSGLQGNSNAPRVSGSIWVAVGRHDLMVRGRARGIPNGELRNYVV